MSMRALVVGAAVLALAAPAAAQQRGTMEFGAFGSAATFDNTLSLKTAVGGGGRIAMYLDPVWSVEFEDAEMRASRPNGLQSVNVGILSGRLMATPLSNGALSLVLGAGAGVGTETNFLHTYGVDVLAGLKYAVSDNASLRLDGVMDFLANYDWKRYQSVRLGLSVFRHPAQLVRTVVTPPIYLTHTDSVSAAETRRLREREAALNALRDSLHRVPVALPEQPRARPEQSIPIRKEPAATKP